jgi:predicted AlkP superfamily pyrophosphatase or phosphodiesterase
MTNRTPYKKRLSIAFLVILVALALSPVQLSKARQGPVTDLKPTLILVSIDGFRADYFQKYQHPTLNTLATEGVRAEWMTPSYPSLTFPNHYTISTGLYPEHHGIVANDIYDPELNATFGMSKRAEVQKGRWWGGEPIWITAEKQGQHSSATFFPGSEAEIEGTRPTYWKTYDDKVTPTERVDAVLTLLDLPLAKRPTFLTLYFSDVDHAGHEYSPESKEVAEAINRVDAALARLIHGLQTRNINESVNLVIVSDHGMAPVPPGQVVVLDNFFASKYAEHVVWGAQVTQIFPKAGKEDELFSSIRTDKLQHTRCYRKQEIPARFHYQASRRIAPVVCMAEEGWRIFSRERLEEELSKPNRPAHLIGAHGYDNQLPSMRAIFVAQGPAFKHGIVIKGFPNVDVYDILASVLGLRPAQNDGDEKTVRQVLR